MSDSNDDLNYDCSREFYLMASGDAPRVGDVDGPSMEVVSPAAFDELSPGETVTVKVRRHCRVFFRGTTPSKEKEISMYRLREICRGRRVNRHE